MRWRMVGGFSVQGVVWLCFAKGGIEAAGMWPNLPLRVHGLPIGCSQLMRRFCVCFIALFGVGEG